MNGFTLIELMIVVAVIGILVAIGYPSYRSQMIKGHRSNVQAFLMEVAQREQRYLLDNRSYTNNLSNLGLTVPTDVSPYYAVSITVPVGNPPRYTLAATPQAGSMVVSDGALSLDSTGQKLPATKW